jgi:hypothetical protein
MSNSDDQGRETTQLNFQGGPRTDDASSVPPKATVTMGPSVSGGSRGPGGLVTALILGAALLVLLFAGAYFGSPLLALYSLQSAARSGNRDALQQLVDFPELRSNLKAELTAHMMKSMRDDPKMANSAAAGVGMLLGGAMINQAIDAYVTPDALAAMVGSGRAPNQGAAATPADTGSTLKTDYGYADLNHFRVRMTRADSPGDALSLIMERRDLLNWKLVRIDFTFPASPAAPAVASSEQPASAAPQSSAPAPSAASVPAAASAAQAQPAVTGQQLAEPGGPATTVAAAPPQQRRGTAPSAAARPRRYMSPDAYRCAHGDPDSDVTIQACDRRDVAAGRGE